MRLPRALSRALPAMLLGLMLPAWTSAADVAPGPPGGPALESHPAERLPWDEAVPLPPAVAEMLQDRRYDEAVNALDKLATGDQVNRDRWLYAKGRALHQAGKYDDAVTAFADAEKAKPEGPWARRARFARGFALARKGDFASAELIYRAEAEWLLSTDRKQSLADIYLEFARKYATPRDEKSPPDQPEADYAKAIEFFQNALELGPKPELRSEIELQLAECFRRAGNFGEAATRFERFIKQFADDRRVTEARYRLGECRLREGSAVEARQRWQDLLALWPGDKRPPGAAQAEFLALAAFGIAETYGLPSPSTDDALVLGTAALENYIKKFPEHNRVNRAHLMIVQSRAARGRFAEAVAAAERFLADPKRAAADEAADVRNWLGLALQLQKKFPEALAAWREFLTKHPTHPAWSQVQQRIIETEFLIGADAFQHKDYVEARKQWNEFLLRYPLDPRSPGILLQFGQMEYLAEKYDTAIAEWRRLVSKYPGQEFSSQAQFRIAQTLEEKLRRPTEAMQEYRKLTWGSQAGAAQSRIAELTAKQLQVATERIFRSDEVPLVKVKSRNIDKLKVRIYKVDLETYFRKMHLARGVESLDLALIDPDRSYEFTVPEYGEFKPCEYDVPIELTAAAEGKRADASPTVLAVTISGRTHEATTLVLQSDLDVIVKSSRNEVFVYAQNMRTGKPWVGARVLVSNGSEVFAEGTTAADGVFRNDDKKLNTSKDVRVFAVAGGHTASNVVGLSDVGLGKGLEKRGYVYTDRAAYRPGQTVHVRGIVRGVADDRFTVVPNHKYRLEVFDERNRVVYRGEVTTGDYGSFHTHFNLPDVAQPGSYRVQACDDDETCFTGGFRVANYQVEPVQFTIDAPRKVVFRGEEIEGTITAKFYYGTPLAGREVRYTLGDGRVTTATTDTQGQIKFKFPTREFSESQTVNLTAELPERNLAASASFIVAVQAFSVSLSTVRDVVTSGESFEVTLRARTADDQPTGEKLRLQVVEQTFVDGRRGESIITSHDVSTDPKSGLGRVTLKLDRGAQYVLRAEGRDRFDNPVTARHEVFVSDDSDTVRLRILADRHTFKLGETGKLRIVWREAPATALVTYQGARILGHRLVDLRTGENELQVPMEAALAPNFYLEINALVDHRGPEPKDRVRRRFHAATVPITVERELAVTLEVKRRGGAEGVPQPGETVDVVVRAVDSQGKPVQAEIGVALIDRANWDRFGPAISAIHDFFRGATREPAIRTAASIEFGYRPTTQAINPRLLSEQDRLEIVVQEEELRKALAMNDRRQQLEVAGSGTLVLGGGLGGGGAFGGNEPQTERFSLGIDLNSNAGMLGNIVIDEPSDARAANQPATPATSPAPAAEPQSSSSSMGRAEEGRAAGRMLSRDMQEKEKAELSDLSPQAGEKQGELDRLGRRTRGEEGGKWEFGVTADKYFADAGNLNSERSDMSAYRGITVLADGVQLNVGQVELNDPQSRTELALRLKRSGALILPATDLQETGYWNPALVTDVEGRATIAITLPERSTVWKLSARGITKETLAGEAESDVTAKNSLFGELSTPLVLTDGDRADVGVTVHDLRERKAGEAVTPIEVTFRATIGGRSVEEKKTIAAGADAAALHELSFAVVATLAKAQAAGTAEPEKKDDASSLTETAELMLTVTAGDKKHSVWRSVPIRPDGYALVTSAGGTARSDVTAWVEPAAGLTLERPRLEIVIGASIDRTLLDVVLGERRYFEVCGSFASPLETSVSDLQAALALQRLLATTRQDGAPESAELTARIRSTIGYLTSAQNDDGGWTWTGSAGTSDRQASARVVWALGEAKAAAYAVADETFDKGVSYLSAQQAAVSDDDLDVKAVLLHALAEAGRGDFAVANRLYRSRTSLTPAGGAHLALALVKMDHAPMAADLLATIAARPADAADPAPAAGRPLLIPARRHAVEEQALLALALQRAAVNVPQLEQAIDRLTAARVGDRWTPERATGPATAALALWAAAHRPGGEKYRLTVVVNEYEADAIDVDPTAPPQSLIIDARHLVPGKQRIQFRMTGRGHLTYQCLLSGFVPSAKLKSTVRTFEVRRTYEPAPREFDGRELPRGFGVLSGSYSSFRNPLTQLPIGRRAHIELNIWRHHEGSTTDDRLEYLVVREPMPAGCAVVESTVRGGFERFEVLPGEIVFYVGNRRYPESIHFDVVGNIGGDFHAARTVVVDVHRPERIAVAEPLKLAVLARGKTSVDAYRYSPDELLELGRRQSARREWKAAITSLGELLSSWNLNVEPQREALRMLLDAHLEVGPAADVVKYFELVKEKSPDVEIPFESILKIGAAYHELGEYERSYLVFRATIESSFGRDGAVAGFLEEQGEFLRSVDVMQRLIDEYPPEPYVAAAQYALAQQVYAYGANVAGDEKLRARKLTRLSLVAAAAKMLDAFLASHPDDPAADEAAFASANARLDLEQFDAAVARCEAYARRYPTSEFIDSYWYVVGYCRFAAGKHEQALEMCRKVAEMKTTDRATGREIAGKNRERAIYILGQVYHSLGKAAEAIREYTRVAEQIPDAKMAIEYFTRRGIELPEVTTIRPGEPSEVALKFRNVAAVDVKAYRIDLMKFSLLRQNLSAITQINLAGIRPLHEETIALGDGKDYRDRERKVTLPVKDEGAYLIVCRGENLHTSGFVLISPLKIEVQEEASSGQVRATVKDVTADRFLSGVHVKVIGSRDGEFKAGETDLRGVFAAEPVNGRTTVIAQLDAQRYAFYRGEVELLPVPAAAETTPQSSTPRRDVQDRDSLQSGKEYLLQELIRGNSSIQLQQQNNLRDNYFKKDNRGVKAKDAF